jgi:flavin-dependent dehydrogenase
MSSCCVTIVGAGPSGAAAAACLARHGVPVTLVDKRTFPRDKTCGDGLIPDAISALRELGVLDEVLKHALKVPFVRLYAPDRAWVDVRGDVACLPREKLDELLVQNARSQGADFYSGCRFIAPVREKGRVVGIRYTTRAGRERELRSQYTLLATGAAPEPLQAAGICLRKEPSGLALRAYFALPPELAAEMRYFAMSVEQALCPGYGWIFAGPNNIFNVGVGLFFDTRRKLPTHNARDLWRLFLDRFEPARRIERTSKQLTPVRGAPFRTALRGARLTLPGLLVIGEAAGTTYSFTAEGIGKALQSGMLAASCIAGARANGDSPEELYERSLIGRFGAQFRAYKRAQDWLSFPIMSNFVVHRARKGGYVKRQLEGFLAETADPEDLFSLKGMAKAVLT